MITAIIFDFGDIFINLEKEAQVAAFKKLGTDASLSDKIRIQNDLFEKGKISREAFVGSFKLYLPDVTDAAIITAWNAIIGEFPLYRLEFLQMLSKKYRLFLLTNTDSIHIDYFEQKVGVSFYTDFYNCFEHVFYSYEMGMRKPDPEIYTTLINKYDLSPKRTLFIDDKKENTEAASKLGIQIWNLQVGLEDVVELFEKIQL